MILFHSILEVVRSAVRAVRSQNVLLKFPPAVMRTLFGSNTLHSSLLNNTLHPASQKFRVEMNDACARPGTMWASVTSEGSHGMSRLHVCVDHITVPSGHVIAIGFLAGLMFTTGAPFIRKFPVAPESNIAYSISFVIILLLNIRRDASKSVRLLACIMWCQACFRFTIPLDFIIGGGIGAVSAGPGLWWPLFNFVG